MKTTVSFDLIFLSLFVIVLLSFVGCSDKEGIVSGGRCTVYLDALQKQPVSTQTRTVIGGENLDKVFWAELDMLGVYWQPAAGNDVLSAQTFECYRPYPEFAQFTASMSEMAEGEYTYYAAYPVPESVNGTTVTYTLPAVQDGTYDMRTYDIRDQSSYGDYSGNCDFMLAEPVTGPALTSLAEGMAMHFVHQCHVMRIQVPMGRNQWGAPLKKLRVEFPTPVVGKMTMDMSEPYGIPQLSEGSNVIIADLKNLLSESTEDAANGNYVWLFICPTSVNGSIRFTAYDTNGYQNMSLSVPVNKTFEAGRITPVTLTIPEELPLTWLDFSITGNNLGEEPRSFTVTAPEGAVFRNGTNTHTFTVNEENRYPLGFYNEYDGIANGDIIRNGMFTITYDSDNAVLSEKRKIDSFTANTRTSIALTVPYLFSEDFGNAGTMDENNDTKELNDYNLPEWSGSRFGLQGNTSAMIFGYLASSVLTDPDGGDNHRGRLDTPLLKGLKDGKSVSLKVRYNVSGTSKNGNTVFGKTTVMYSKYGFGTDTKTGALNGDDNSIETVFYEEEPGTGGSYTNIPNQREIVVSNCTNKHRLSWRASFRVDGQGLSTITAGRTYVYIDNIYVSIQKE